MQNHLGTISLNRLGSAANEVLGCWQLARIAQHEWEEGEEARASGLALEILTALGTDPSYGLCLPEESTEGGTPLQTSGDLIAILLNCDSACNQRPCLCISLLSAPMHCAALLHSRQKDVI